MKQLVSTIGKSTINSLEELGYASMVLLESLQWIVLGKFRRQPIRFIHVFNEAMNIGVRAIPIVSILCMAVGGMLAMQGIETLRPYGAQSQVIVGIALSVTREFSALIVGILVAGRSGSAIAARIGTMMESQEIDALRVIGIDPLRYLAAPMLIAMLIMVPALTVLGDILGMLGSAVYSAAELNMTVATYMERSFDVIKAGDIMQGLAKSVMFAIIIVLVGIVNGFQVSGGAEGVGRATTRSVVMCISLIVVSDMVFTYFLTMR
jgi:phospholipid/cholesterol/gamma-HCH transport system permease protein